MKKSKVIFLPLFLMALTLTGFSNKVAAQCCNVFASNGTAVTTTEGNCTTLSYPTTVCEQTLVEIITVDVWVFYYDAFEDVRFSTDSDVIHDNSYKSLDKIATAMKSSSYILKITGYADSTGTDDHNKELSVKRALAVKKYLVQNGVSENRIALAAYGEKMPKAPNATKRGRAKNRRVEIDLYY